MKRAVLNPTLSCNIRTSLTEETINQFAGLIERGLPLETACDYICLPTATFWLWSRKGDQWIKNEQIPKNHEIYGIFVLTYKRALARYKAGMVERMNDTESSMWVRDMTILERRDRRNYSRNEPLGGDTEDYDPDEKFM